MGGLDLWVWHRICGHGTGWGLGGGRERVLFKFGVVVEIFGVSVWVILKRFEVNIHPLDNVVHLFLVILERFDLHPLNASTH